ncbi:MAG: helix-turn-helix domain-containing protein, partial [Atribacterota bacterium]
KVINIPVSEIGKRIKIIRKQKKLSLKELAEKTELSKSFLSELERSKKSPRIATLKKIAEGLGVNVNLILEK